MKWSYRIARVAGIEVRLHVTFLLLLLYWGWQGYTKGSALGALVQVVFVSLLFFCVLLHEFGHAFAARAYGIRTPDITLLPIGGVARLERMPRNPIQEFVIAIAGPMVNVVIALVLWIALGFPPLFDPERDFDGWAQMMAFNLLGINGILIAFNLIPAFPMDGGRMLRALLALPLSHEKATRIAARTGQVIAVLFALIGLFGVPEEIRAIPVLGLVSHLFGPGQNPFLLFIAMFIFMGAQQEAVFAGLRESVKNMVVSDAMITRFQTFLADMPLAAAAEEAQRDMQPVYPVTDAHLRSMGMVLRNDLLAAGNGSATTVGALAKVVPTVPADSGFDEAFSLMQQSGSPILPVVNLAGQVVGLVSLNLLRERAQKPR